jgi:hypothetical protein
VYGSSTLKYRERSRDMQPILSAEVRWFCEGELPEEVLPSFWSGDLPTNEKQGEPRIDFYLYLPGVDDIGIKLRGEINMPQEVTNEMKLEVKSRQREAGVISFLNGVSGHLEYWNKSEFSGESANPERFTTLRKESEAWIGVSKERYLRKYEVEEGKGVQPVPANARYDNGCQVELTKLMTEHKLWWTFGFEAFGETEEALENNLKLSANDFFGKAGWEMFEEKDSYGYPRWLNLLMAV